MRWTKVDIENLDRKKRLNLINSITGIKPANLVGTKEGAYSNLAIISSVVHLGSNPAMVGFIIRPSTVERNTLENIKKTGNYTINNVTSHIQKKAHYTSIKLPKEKSEFEKCHLTEEYINDFRSPFVKESNIKIGLSLEEIVPIKSNGTAMIVGRVEILEVQDECLNELYYIDLEKSKSVGISGLNSYYDLKKTASYPYVRIKEFPPKTWDN